MPGIEVYSMAAAVTPSDATPVNCSAVYVGGAGNVAILPKSGATPVVFTAVPVGSILPVNCVMIRATGTTATLLIGLWT